MKAGKDILFKQEARTKLLAGINILADATASTLGPLGRNVTINNAHGTPDVYHDGVTVARNINLTDPFEDMGAELLKAAAIRTNEIAGDGTTTSIILAQAIVKEAMKNITAGANPMTLKREIELSLIKVLEELEKIKKPIKTDEEIEQIATISSADPLIGKLVAEAIIKVGKDGVVTAEEGSGFETTVTYTQGMEIDRGYLSPYFVTNQETVESIIEDAYVLITDKKLNYDFDILPFLENVAKVSKNIVIFAGEVVEQAMAVLVVNNLRGTIKCVAIQAPAFGGRRVDELEDIAVLTGGKIILADSGRDLKSVTIEELGRAGKVVSDRDKTIIMDGKGNVKKRIEDLREQIKTANTDYDKQIKQERLAKLASGVAVINVGAATDVEIKEKKERVIDAINATKAAVEEGIVAGGEMTLYDLSRRAFWSGLHGLGAAILRAALKQPFRKLIENAGIDYAEALQKIGDKKYPFGIDVMDGEVKNLIESGILDPVLVTRSALENAVSVAVMTITTDILITDEAKEK